MDKLCSLNVDLVSIWRLDDASRFPTTPDAWESVRSVPPAPEVRVSVDRPFDLVANPYGRRPVRNTFREMVSVFPESFDEAAYALKPHEWRTLYYLDLYPMTALGDPRFDAKRAIEDILDRDPSLNDVPQEWTGSPDSAPSALLDIRVTLADTRPDTAKALWAILAFARSIGMQKNEVLHVPWWLPWWFESYLSRSE